MSIYDMLLANAMGEGGGGGGGGSSDFSTATVTVMDENEYGAVINGPFLYAGYYNVIYPDVVCISPQIMSDQVNTATIVLYNGQACIECMNSFDVSGNATKVDADAPEALITGDCTITITA